MDNIIKVLVQRKNRQEKIRFSPFCKDNNEIVKYHKICDVLEIYLEKRYGLIF